jgi:hypothetical protein
MSIRKKMQVNKSKVNPYNAPVSYILHRSHFKPYSFKRKRISIKTPSRLFLNHRVRISMFSTPDYAIGLAT